MKHILREFAEFKPTVAWMTQKFNELNRKCFNNELPECFLRITKLSKKTLGNFAPHTNTELYTKKDGTIMYDDLVTVDGHSAHFKFEIDKEWILENCKPVISLNNIYAMSEKEWLSVLIHEMCHYSSFIKGKMDSSNENNSHGKIFHQECEDAARKMGEDWTAEYIETSEQLKEVVDDEAAQTEASRISNGYIVLALYNSQKLGKQITLGYLTKEWSLVQELYAFSMKDPGLTGIAYLDDKLLYAKLSLRYKTSQKAFTGQKFNIGFSSDVDEALPIIEEVKTNKNLKVILDREHGVDEKIDTGASIKKGPFSYVVVVEDVTGTKYMYLCQKTHYDQMIQDLQSFIVPDNLVHINVYDDQDFVYSLINTGYKKARNGYGNRYNITKNEAILNKLGTYKPIDLIS